MQSPCCCCYCSSSFKTVLASTVSERMKFLYFKFFPHGLKYLKKNKNNTINKPSKIPFFFFFFLTKNESMQ